MRKITTHLTTRMIIGIAATIPFVLAPTLAHAQAPGALTQLTSPSNCIMSTSNDSGDCQTTATGLNGSENIADNGTEAVGQTIVASRDGTNVYVIGSADDAVAEFARNADGSLTEIGCIADSSDSDSSSCTNATATGMVAPKAIAISQDGQNVYVAASDAAGNGDIAEFTRNANGTLTPVSGNDCIQENQEDGAGCDTQGAHGLEDAVALVVSANGDNVYVGDGAPADAVTTLTRNPADGSLTEAGDNPAADCIQDEEVDSSECSNNTSGLSEVTGVAISLDGDNVYTSGAPNPGSSGSIAEFAVDEGGTLSSIGCIGTPEDFDDESCGSAATGLVGITGLVVSPDGANVYTASQSEGGPIAEFSRGAGGTLTQLQPPNDCIEEQGAEFGCGTTGTGIGNGYELAMSSDDANLYAAAPTNECDANSCQDVAEFARDTANGGALTQLSSPDSCIQESSAGGSECPGNEGGSGLGGWGIAASQDGDNVYVAGDNAIAEFARGTHTLTVSLAGSGTGAVADDTGAISCPSACSNAYTTDTTVTLTAPPASGSTFAAGAAAGVPGPARAR